LPDGADLVGERQVLGPVVGDRGRVRQRRANERTDLVGMGGLKR